MRQRKENVSPMSYKGRNLYVVEHITDSLLDLMKQKHLSDISIGELCNKAGVGRASFYRNFRVKEDVITRELKKRLETWWLSAIVKPDFYFTQALFEYFHEERNIYMLLYRQGLSHLNLQSIKEACGPKPDQMNVAAYLAAFFAYGLYGWIDEWFVRGMKESPKEISEILEKVQPDKK